MRRWLHVLAVPVLWTSAAVILWPGPFDLFTDPFTLSVFVFMVAGAILVAKVPGNSIGTMLLGYASLTSASLVAQAVAVAWGRDGVRAAWADTVGVALATAAIMPLPLAMLHFPDGRLPSARWAPVKRLIFLGALVGVSASILNGGWGGDPGTESPDSPLRALTEPAGDVLSSLFFVLLPLSFALAGAAVVRRYVRASGIERRQIKLIALVGVIVVVALTLLSVLSRPSVDTSFGASLLASSLASWPVAVTVAVLRYRLYDIDRLISRTVSYGLVTAVLVGVYLGAAFILGSLPPLEGELAVAGSTLLAAALFNPLRRRIQNAVDRRFNRSRFDAQLTMEALSRRLANEVDLSALGLELEQIAYQTMQPANVQVWVRGIRG